MGVRYIETYIIPGTSELGIEDYDDGRGDKDHFDLKGYKAGTRKRFQLWSGGCGVGQASTLSRARAAVFEYATERLTKLADGYKQKLDEANQSIGLLGDDVFNLGRYRV